ncbi:MAG: hypothetical protein M3P13_14660, partial [Acidobacteriota bacterium]|nr:hypothetical protein [Acidobacteriota bacterium]
MHEIDGGGDYLFDSERLVRRAVRIRLLPPFELAVEQIAIDVEVGVRVAVSDPRRRKPGLGNPGRFDERVGDGSRPWRPLSEYRPPLH